MKLVYLRILLIDISRQLSNLPINPFVLNLFLQRILIKISIRQLQLRLFRSQLLQSLVFNIHQPLQIILTLSQMHDLLRSQIIALVKCIRSSHDLSVMKISRRLNVITTIRTGILITTPLLCNRLLLLSKKLNYLLTRQIVNFSESPPRIIQTLSYNFIILNSILAKRIAFATPFKTDFYHFVKIFKHRKLVDPSQIILKKKKRLNLTVSRSQPLQRLNDILRSVYFLQSAQLFKSPQRLYSVCLHIQDLQLNQRCHRVNIIQTVR